MTTPTVLRTFGSMSDKPTREICHEAATLIERQAAQIEQMREAMLCTDPEMTHHNFIAALEATPDQALEQFAGRVREQCAEVCEEHQGSAETCADAIRAIKELP